MGDFPRIRRVIRPDNHYFSGNQNDLSRYLFGNDQIKGGAACALRYRHPLLHALARPEWATGRTGDLQRPTAGRWDAGTFPRYTAKYRRDVPLIFLVAARRQQ